MMKQIGIEKISIYPSSMGLALSELVGVRGDNGRYIEQTLMVNNRSLVPLWEDTVTLAVNCAREMLTLTERGEIGLFIIATETGLDQEKAISTWAHRYLQLPDDCRVFEIKVACHAGVAALKMAESWIASGLNNGKKVLLINVDISNNMARHGMMEYSLGAGAIALLISDQPAFAVIETGKSAVYTCDVTDVIRPLPWLEIAADVEASLYAYIDGLVSTFAAYCQQTPEAKSSDYFAYHLYHLPFPGISQVAHRALLEHQNVFDNEAVAASFTCKVAPSLYYARQMGATYCGSLFLALFSLIRQAPDIKSGDRIGLYSYGSGSCAEYFSMLIGDEARTLAAEQGLRLDRQLAQRKMLNVAAYEQLEAARNALWQQRNYRAESDEWYTWLIRHYHGSGHLILESIDNFVRYYRYV